MENVLIIGNGFDLDLGLPTSYSQFAESDYWPKAAPRHIPPIPYDTGIVRLGRMPHPVLLEHILARKKLSTWFDLENELLQYAKIENKVNGKERDSFINTNIQYYLKLQEALCNYISEIQNNEIKKDSVAGMVLSAVINTGTFHQIYSFNYTDLHNIARLLNIKRNFSYTHIHGKIEDKSIILGVDNSELRPGYEQLRKTSSHFYHFHDLTNTLASAHEIVFFGMSFGKIDYSYFGDFFKELSDGIRICEKDKQNITIFTRDNKSELEIKNHLFAAGINTQRLFAQCHFDIICTTEINDKEKLSTFLDRINRNR